VPVHGSPRGTVCPDDIPVILDTIKKATAILIGCGMGNTEDTAEVLSAVLKNAVCPVIIDADGINALSSHIHLLDDITTEVILTPHIKEFSRLSGLSVETVLSDPAKAASDFAFSHRGVTLALKSHRTYITRGSEPGSEPGSELYENTAGNSGMAKGGSGDVLAGIIASLTAQGAKPLDAAAAGVHIHALAGDAAAAEKSKTAMLPSDIIEALPRIYSRAESASKK
jgi:NAD(P)H-hydrate epimerase